ncbi:MAG: response regulator transcription factor [Candidatus Calescibacterium sp.]|nr:response regulator transcription factor [Candidatus Calescibacterium sp.]
MKILLVGDDRYTFENIHRALKNFYIIECAPNGEEGEYFILTSIYDLLIIDYFLPDMTGPELCKKIRSAKVMTPIIILSGNGDVQNKILALNNGADDYMTKPFIIDELKARIEAFIRRMNEVSDSSMLCVEDLVFDLRQRKVYRSGKYIPLKRKELDILEYLMRNSGRVLTRSMIINHVWKSETEATTNVVDVHIKYLRDSIDRSFSKKLIKTVHGYGYKLEP